MKKNWLRIPPKQRSGDYPWTVSKSCHRCAGASSIRAWPWKCVRAWKDKRGVRWAEYACPEGHIDYWNVTIQVFRQLTGREERGH